MALDPPGLDRLQHPPAAVRLPDQADGFRLESVRERFDRERTTDRIHGVGHAALVRQELLGPQGDPDRLLRRKRERLVHAVRVERLGASEDRGEGLDRDPDRVVLRLLRGERHARGLGMESQFERLRFLGMEPLPHDRRPESARGAELGDLLEQVDVRVEEERDLRRDRVDVEAARHGRLQVSDPIREGEADLLCGGRARLADVVAAHADRVPPRNLAGAELDHVEGEAHRGRGRVDVRRPRDVLLQDVVLDGPAERSPRDAARLADGQVEDEEDCGGRVDRHARAHPIEREASEQGVHVLDRRNRDADASDLAAGHWCIAVVAHLRRQVERDAQPFVALGEEVLEPPVRLLRGPETSILAHRPEPTAVHRRMDATGEGRLPRESDAFPVYVRL